MENKSIDFKTNGQSSLVTSNGIVFKCKSTTTEQKEVEK